MGITRRLMLISVVLVTCVGCDRVTKSIAESFLAKGDRWSFLGGTLRLQLAYNDGAFLSLGASLPEAWRLGIFSVGVGGMLSLLLSYALFAKSAGPSMILALALLFAGGVGNLVDRVMYDGHVIDFINIGIGPLRTGIFNVADMAVTAGALILAAGIMRERNAAG